MQRVLRVTTQAGGAGHEWEAGAIETAAEFGRRMYSEAWQRGWSRAAKKVVIADGAVWIWNIADREFPGAIQIVDLYHARDYFDRNAQRMRYPDFRRQKLFVGSGVIEAACKTVIAKRLKLSGMFWTLRGANAIIALRCYPFNREFEDYWCSPLQAA